MARGMLARWLDSLRGYGSRLDDFETAIVEAVANELDAASSVRLRLRANAINRVQRLLGGQDTTLYQMRGRPVFPAETAIVEQHGTVRFARVMIRSADPMTRLKATLFLHEGNLAAIEFDRRSKFADATHIEEVRVTILGPPFIDPDAEEERRGWPLADR